MKQLVVLCGHLGSIETGQSIMHVLLAQKFEILICMSELIYLKFTHLVRDMGLESELERFDGWQPHCRS
tara:strand:- start:309 stop:515 length:207 start_codon:yes stop_codon:yes gene_type:complete